MDRRDFVAGLGLLTLGAAAGFGTGFAAEPSLVRPGPAARTATPGESGACAATVTFRTAPSANLVALTIDDGPTSQWTPQVLRILQRYRAKATFFRTGKHCQAAPDLVIRTAEAEHEQGNHTWAHEDLTRHDAAFVRATLQRTHELLLELTGKPPALCRPPYGRIDAVGLNVCADLHYAVILWSSHVTGSYARSDVDAALARACSGSILLVHDGGSDPNAVLMTQLDRLVGSMTDAGYEFVTVSELLAGSHELTT